MKWKHLSFINALFLLTVRPFVNSEASVAIICNISDLLSISECLFEKGY